MLNKNIKIYETYMKRALVLAGRANGKTSPNPMVGAVVLDKDLNFVSEGYHKKCGEPHAEVNAINNALKKGIDIKNGTIIVTLEPCSHYGKTPPCADLIIKSGLKNLVVGCVDPNKKVAGNGIKKCQDAGLNVIVGVLDKECRQLNEKFFKNQVKNLPYVTIKTATTLDGKIATKTKSSKWITGDLARRDVQKLRNEYDAILTSSVTVIEDNPSLTCRLKNGKNPVRIIVDAKSVTKPDSKVYSDDGTRVILVTVSSTDKYPSNVEVLVCKEKNGHVDLSDMLKKLYRIGICSILVEAGGGLNAAFVENKLADKLIKYTAPKILGDDAGINFVSGFDIEDINLCTKLELFDIKKLGQDVRADYYFID